MTAGKTVDGKGVVLDHGGVATVGPYGPTMVMRTRRLHGNRERHRTEERREN